jgi:hypothetical protein
MEQEMTARPSIRRRNVVVYLGGGIEAVKAVRVEHDFHPIATAGAAARGWKPRKATAIHDRLQQHPLICGRRCYTIGTDCFPLRAREGVAAADFPVVTPPWDQGELARVLPTTRAVSRAPQTRSERWRGN